MTDPGAAVVWLIVDLPKSKVVSCRLVWAWTLWRLGKRPAARLVPTP